MELEVRMVAKHVQDSWYHSKKRSKEIEYKRKERERQMAVCRGSIIAREVYLRNIYCSLEILPGNRCSEETQAGDSGAYL